MNKVILKYIPYNNFFNVLLFFRSNKIKNLKFKHNYIIPLKLYIDNMIGGSDYNLNIKINGTEYMVHVDEYDDLGSDERKIINLIKIKAKKNNDEYNENDHCGILIIDNDMKISAIQSVSNYTDCIKYLDDKEFKIGDILTQIMIILSYKNKMKQINLTDNSYFLCNNITIPLIHVRTMTMGEPFYCKYGFRPIDEYDIWKKNKEIFLTYPHITKNNILKFLMYKKFDKSNENDKKMLKYINKIIIPRLKENNIVSELLINIINDNSHESCYLLVKIHMKIYIFLGYELYFYKNFNLNLKDIKL